jgi:hypothetical protein
MLKAGNTYAQMVQLASTPPAAAIHFEPPAYGTPVCFTAPEKPPALPQDSPASGTPSQLTELLERAVVDQGALAVRHRVAHNPIQLGSRPLCLEAVQLLQLGNGRLAGC